MTWNLVNVTLQAGVPPPNTPLLSEASSAESGDDSQVSPTSPLSESEYGEYPVSSYGPAPPLPSELPDLNQSKHDLDQSIDLNNVKDTNIYGLVSYINGPDNQPLSSLQSSQSDVEDTGGLSPVIPRMYEEDVVAPSDPDEEEEFRTERRRSRFKTTARKHVTPQSCNRQNQWAQIDITEDDDDSGSEYDYKKDKGKRFLPNVDFSTDSNTDSDDHSEGPEKKRKKKEKKV